MHREVALPQTKPEKCMWHFGWSAKPWAAIGEKLVAARRWPIWRPVPEFLTSSNRHRGKRADDLDCDQQFQPETAI